MEERRSYQRPELVELGPAGVLTLGGKGCKDDALHCKFNVGDD